MEEWWERPTGFPKVDGSNPSSGVFPPKLSGDFCKYRHICQAIPPLKATQLSKFQSHQYYAKGPPNPMVFEIVSWPPISSLHKFKGDVIWPCNVLLLFDITERNKNITNSYKSLFMSTDVPLTMPWKSKLINLDNLKFSITKYVSPTAQISTIH